MEFEFAVSGLGDEKENITRWTEKRVASLPGQEKFLLSTIVSEFGRRSAKAQALSGSITDLGKVCGQQHTLYIHATRSVGQHGRPTTVVQGGLKVGCKSLFVADDSGTLVKTEPLCVLDFYVHEGCQRGGIGLKLFQHMLCMEGAPCASSGEKTPLCWQQLAYDRPSPKLLGFIRKHYHAQRPMPQNNSYVIFDDFLRFHGKAPQRRAATVAQRPLTGQHRSALATSHLPLMHPFQAYDTTLHRQGPAPFSKFQTQQRCSEGIQGIMPRPQHASDLCEGYRLMTKYSNTATHPGALSQKCSEDGLQRRSVLDGSLQESLSTQGTRWGETRSDWQPERSMSLPWAHAPHDTRPSRPRASELSTLDRAGVARVLHNTPTYMLSSAMHRQAHPNGMSAPGRRRQPQLHGSAAVPHDHPALQGIDGRPGYEASSAPWNARSSHAHMLSVSSAPALPFKHSRVPSATGKQAADVFSYVSPCAWGGAQYGNVLPTGA